MPTALALRHTPYVNMDLVGEWLAGRGFALATIDPPRGDLRDAAQAVADADVLVVLGGAMGVYERAAHPWIDAELPLLRARIDAGKPTLGLCLGAQLMAASLGAEVRRGEAGAEVGWPEIALTEAGRAGPLAALDGARVMQWHSDTFALPAGAQLLARNAQYAHQAFSVGRHALALQFHLEVTHDGLAAWLKDKSDTYPDLAATGWTIETLLEATAREAPQVRARAMTALDAWLDGARG